jgi:hypothetical protein
MTQQVILSNSSSLQANDGKNIISFASNHQLEGQEVIARFCLMESDEISAEMKEHFGKFRTFLLKANQKEDLEMSQIYGRIYEADPPEC